MVNVPLSLTFLPGQDEINRFPSPRVVVEVDILRLCAPVEAAEADAPEGSVIDARLGRLSELGRGNPNVFVLSALGMTAFKACWKNPVEVCIIDATEDVGGDCLEALGR